MRQNLFLHFLNRDTREIFKLDELVERDHSRLLTQALNAAVILCEDAVYSPPGFILEDNLLFRLAEQAKPFLTSGVWKLPIREHSLTDYAEKKRTDYGKIRDRYSGLFDDTRLSYLSSHASGLVSREAEITSGIIKGFQKGPDGDSLAWKKVKKSFSSNEVVSASKLPLLAVEQGQAATWSVLEQLIEADPQIALSVLRPTLQHTYFDLYCQEYGLIILSGVPSVIANFWLPERPNIYCFSRFRFYLSALNLDKVLLDAPADLLIELRQRNPFIDFIDTYLQLASFSQSNHDLQYRVREVVKYKGMAQFTHMPPSAIGFQAMTPMEIDILSAQLEVFVEGCSELYDTKRRTDETNKGFIKNMSIPTLDTRSSLVLFVALREELDVLKSILDLKVLANGNVAARGVLHGRTIEVICPRDMGRVPASSYMTRYLASQSSPRETNILVLGLAGGFAENGIEEGVILCPNLIADYATRKVLEVDGKAATKLRPRHFNLDNSLQTYLDSDSFNTDEWALSVKNDFSWRAGRIPSLNYGPIASGEEVIASEQTAKLLLEDNSKLLGVEMEAGGVCYAAELFGAKVFVLRAVSDMADLVKSDNEWRSLGMKAMGALLKRDDMAGWITKI